MRAFRFLTHGGALKTTVLVLAFFLSVSGKSFAATDWSPIQTALGTNGTEFPGDVLRFELARLDLTVTAFGQTLPQQQVATVANGYIGFKSIGGSQFFVDGSLPAQESEIEALQVAIRQDKHFHITAIVNHDIQETPKLIWLHFEAVGDGGDLASSLATALKVIHSPQGVSVIPGTNNVINPSSILPPNFLKLFDEGFVEQLTDIFAFYLPRPDEHRISLGPVRAETGLGVGQSFYILIPFSGGTNQATLNIEFALRADEIQPVEDTLRAGGFTIAAEHNNFVTNSNDPWRGFDATPQLYFVDASASGDGLSLGNTLYSVIQIIEQKSKARY
jgi:hypothetical protein